MNERNLSARISFSLGYYFFFAHTKANFQRKLEKLKKKRTNDIVLKKVLLVQVK